MSVGAHISRQRPKELRVFGRQPTFDNMLSTGTSFQENIYSHDFSKIADLQSSYRATRWRDMSL